MRLVQANKLIAHAAHAFYGDAFNAFLSELVTDGTDVYVDGAIVAAHGAAQTARIDFSLRNRLAGRACKHFEKGQFRARERNLLAVIVCAALSQVDLQFADLYRSAVVFVAGHATQNARMRATSSRGEQGFGT